MEDKPTIKLITLGNASVGKTCLLLRFTEGLFPRSTMATLGIDCRLKTLVFNEKTVNLQLWDTAGQEKHHNLISPSFYRRAHGILLVFDWNDRRSFEGVRNWMNQISLQLSTAAVVVLVGNKADLEKNVTFEEARTLADSFGISLYEASAKTGEGVNEAFETLARNCVNRTYSLGNSPRKGVNLEKYFSKSEKGCC